MNAPGQEGLQIDVKTSVHMRRMAADPTVPDVCDESERQIGGIEPSPARPIGELPNHLKSDSRAGASVVLRQHGVLRLQAAPWLRGHGGPAAVKPECGIDALADRIDRTMTRY